LGAKENEPGPGKGANRAGKPDRRDRFAANSDGGCEKIEQKRRLKVPEPVVGQVTVDDILAHEHKGAFIGIYNVTK
jgi:hypothetical protein